MIEREGGRFPSESKYLRNKKTKAGQKLKKFEKHRKAVKEPKNEPNTST
jgi:hypothetical protein